MCDVAVSNCHACDNGTPKKSIIENQTCDYRRPKLTMACVGACACLCVLFLVRLEASSYFKLRRIDQCSSRSKKIPSDCNEILTFVFVILFKVGSIIYRLSIL